MGREGGGEAKLYDGEKACSSINHLLFSAPSSPDHSPCSLFEFSLSETLQKRGKKLKFNRNLLNRVPFRCKELADSSALFFLTVEFLYDAIFR
jgi:hypothetical protein